MSEVTSNRLKRLAHLEDGAGIVEMAEDEARCMRKICETTLQKIFGCSDRKDKLNE